MRHAAVSYHLYAAVFSIHWEDIRTLRTGSRHFHTLQAYTEPARSEIKTSQATNILHLFLMVLPAGFHVQYLAESGQYLRTIAALEIFLDQLQKTEGVLILELYFTLLAACCHMALGNRDKAKDYVERAVELALPDGFIMLLGNFSQHLDGMVEKALGRRNKDALVLLRRNNDSHIRGIKILQNEYLKKGLPESLTKREQDVARLAAKGYHNSEIAKKLSITENTVRAHLRSVFQKLEIDRRAGLAEKLTRKGN